MELIFFQMVLCFGFVTKAVVIAVCCGRACMALGLSLFPTLPQQKVGGTWDVGRGCNQDTWPKLTKGISHAIEYHGWRGFGVFLNVGFAWRLTRCQYQCAFEWLLCITCFCFIHVYCCFLSFSFFLVPCSLFLPVLNYFYLNPWIFLLLFVLFSPCLRAGEW